MVTVNCPSGTYYSDQDCLSCPVGSYNPLEAQTECEPCPAGQITDGEGAVNQTECYSKYYKSQ